MPLQKEQMKEKEREMIDKERWNLFNYSFRQIVLINKKISLITSLWMEIIWRLMIERDESDPGKEDRKW